MYELIIVWHTAECEKHTYNTMEEAKRIEAGYKKAFGRQIIITDIRRTK